VSRVFGAAMFIIYGTLYVQLQVHVDGAIFSSDQMLVVQHVFTPSVLRATFCTRTRRSDIILWVRS
jgi:hypothetical protein